MLAPPVHKRIRQGRPLLDKGKPAARRGRKATGQAASLIAGLPKEGGAHPREHWWSPRKEETPNVLESAGRRHVRRVRPSPGRSPLGGSPGGSGSPRCLLDCPDHEYRRKPFDGSGVLSRLLRNL